MIKRQAFRLSIALLTFIIGIAAVSLWFFVLRPLSSTPCTHSTNLEDIPTVSYCDLVNHPDLYNGRTVRVQAVIVGGESVPLYDSKYFHDAECMATSHLSLAEFDRSGDSCPEVLERLDTILRRRELGHKVTRASVVVVARFDGLNPDDWRNGINRYNYRGYNSKLTILRVEGAERTADDVPWTF